MDDAESVELEQEGVEWQPVKAEITIFISFKNGEERTIKFETPKVSDVYMEPITELSIHQIISSAFSVGDVPFLALPAGEGTTYFDLSAVNYVDVEVRYPDEPDGA